MGGREPHTCLVFFLRAARKEFFSPSGVRLLVSRLEARGATRTLPPPARDLDRSPLSPPLLRVHTHGQPPARSAHLLCGRRCRASALGQQECAHETARPAILALLVRPSSSAPLASLRGAPRALAASASGCCTLTRHRCCATCCSGSSARASSARSSPSTSSRTPSPLRCKPIRC